MFEYEIQVPGIRLYEKNNILVLCSEKKLITLNSSVLGGGFNTPNFVVNQQVISGYSGDDPMEDLAKGIKEIEISPDQCVGMMTAAHVKDAAVESEGNQDISVTAIVTAGTSNAMAAGGTPPPMDFQGMGTINIILLVDGNLTEGGMVNAVITATEAKTMALQDLKIKDIFTGEPASGTSTDAVVIAATGKGESLPYAGTATVVGGMIGRTVRKSVTEAIHRYFRYKEIHG
ncbi:adenosylcobinamide amidohydrolase [Dehalobacterium formicoaceticum]|uniref:Adenosylcobinamide amidohydrolase n=1 Tax=Dehalobacterium formicoaceticum TaxID=51515 RepID=A0ABT1Y1W4_9FIRM|nr:adenosylcobinamide amidohydrolase [Dehalobacterium formicoaceticum]MCR6544857.1 adenosylcobinamide amidohydrolase [Dehalobacterium formicoaceticum]